jgi:hypothetical protein
MTGYREELHYARTLLAADEPGRSMIRAIAKELPYGKLFQELDAASL